MRGPALLAPWSVLLLLGSAVSAQNTSVRQKALKCNDQTGILCTEVFESIGYGGEYIGHDEPSLLFYSNLPGSGNTNRYFLKLPKDPPTLPKQDGTGGTFNFQLHPAFWFGMAMCDDQSAPNPTAATAGSSPFPNIPCKPDSDSNVFDGSDPAKPDYIGKHPGAAFMEMQFYPPGNLFISCDVTHWCAALNIDSLSENLNTPGTGQYGGQGNNAACGGDIEYVNFAYIQTDGVPFPPGSPSPLGPFVATNANTLLMDPGDELVVTLRDTAHGLKITVDDLTTGQSGFMVASAANGFAEILFDPNGNNCDFATHNIPTDFHPMYATASEHTRVPWAAHTYNIAFSDEIGHFEYCSTVSSEGNCTSSGANDPPGPDENFCYDGAFAASFGFLPIGGCLDGDQDFDGVPYQNTWPGTFTDPRKDKLVHAQPVRFTSPLFKDSEGETRNYSRVAFETDLARIEVSELSPNNNCQRHISNPADPNPGAGCVNPPVGASFYPLFTTAPMEDSESCVWQLGGAHIPGTTNTFGGSSTTEFGQLLPLAYPGPGGVPTFRYGDFRRVLENNPCPVREEE